jgi:hypothetical protein
VATEQLAAALAAAQGAEVSMPDPQALRDEFDRQLEAEPLASSDPEQFELRQALGLPT